MSDNKGLHKARNVKDDEFYTRFEDIEKELCHYTEHFRDRIVYCNCDNPRTSNFWKYFHINFQRFGIKKLVSTYFDKENPVIKAWYCGGSDSDISKFESSFLKGDGDFRSLECVEILRQSDLIVSNPPFSLTRKYYFPLIIENNKKFLVIGDVNTISDINIFPLIKEDKVWLGYNTVSDFYFNGQVKKCGNRIWFTNLSIDRKYQCLELTQRYSDEKYPFYDNFKAINIDKTQDIPYDYDGIMGVPITFLKKYNPSQFEILGIMDRGNRWGLRTKIYTKEDSPRYNDLNRCGAIYMNGVLKNTYMRIFIRRRKQNE